MELDETGDLGQLGVAAQPHLLEGLFGASLHAESVHGNEHYPSPSPGLSPVSSPQRRSLRQAMNDPKRSTKPAAMRTAFTRSAGRRRARRNGSRYHGPDSLVLRRVYSGNLLFQLMFKGDFRDSNPERQSRWFELRSAVLTLRRDFDRFCPLFRNAFLASLYEKTNRGSC